MEVKVSGLEEFLKCIVMTAKEVDKDIEKEMKRINEQIADDSRDLCPVRDGLLRESIQTRYIRNGDTLTAETFTDCEYGAYVEFGTGIVGQNANLVREGIDLTYRQTPWRYKDENGKWWYTQGQAPQPYLYPAMKQNEDEIINGLSKAVTLRLKGRK